MQLDAELFEKLVLNSGLRNVGVLTRDEAESVLQEQVSRLESWQREDFNGEMRFMSRPSSFYTDFDHILPETRSVITLAISYHSDFPHPSKLGYGRVSRYAWGKDYHKVLKKRLKKLVRSIESVLPEPDQFKWRIFSDAVPLLERSLFRASGAGFIGKNSMMIIPGTGSWTFIAEILTNLDISASENLLKVLNPSQDCGTCSRCLDGCPTQAFSDAYSLDARKCISYLTIEKRSEFSEWDSQALGDWIFGCDVCQEVCPFNHAELPMSDDEKFAPVNGAGPYLKLSEVFQIENKQQFLDRFAGTPIMRAGREKLIANALAVVSNNIECLEDGELLESLRGLRRGVELGQPGGLFEKQLLSIDIEQ